MLNSLKNIFVSAWEVLEVVFIATVTVFLIRTFLVQPFVVSCASMEPTFSERDYLLIDEVTYRFRDPERGEVIVFRYPLDERTFFIKRIIGMPGETVISENGLIRVLKDGKEIAINEAYLSPGARTDDTFTVRLGEDQYFVLGDNRSHSFDSKNWGAVQRKEIVGLARLRIFPLNRLSLFEAPSY